MTLIFLSYFRSDRSSVVRLSSEEKVALTKKDEHDENVSLTILSNITNDSKETSPSDQDRSTSPPPAKKQEMELPRQPTPIESTATFHGSRFRQTSLESQSVDSQSSAYVSAVLPIPTPKPFGTNQNASRESSLSKSDSGSNVNTSRSEKESSVSSIGSVGFMFGFYVTLRVSPIFRILGIVYFSKLAASSCSSGVNYVSLEGGGDCRKQSLDIDLNKKCKRGVG